MNEALLFILKIKVSLLIQYLEEAKLDEKVGDDLAESSASSRSSDSRSKTGKDKEDNRVSWIWDET